MANRRPIEVVVTHRVELSPELADALARLLTVGTAPRAQVPPAQAAPEPPRRRRGRPRKDETRQVVATGQPLSVPAGPITLDAVRTAFWELVQLPGGELRAATVMSQFRLPHVADARPEQFASLLEALQSAVTET